MTKHAWRSLMRSVLVFTNVLFLLLGSVLVTLGGAFLGHVRYAIRFATINAVLTARLLYDKATWCRCRT